MTGRRVGGHGPTAGAGRRRVLTATGTVLLAGLSGCSDFGGETTTRTDTPVGLEGYRTAVEVEGLEVFVNSYGGAYGTLPDDLEIEGGFFYQPPSDGPERLRVRQFAIEFLGDSGAKLDEVVATNDGDGWALVPEDDERASRVEWAVQVDAYAAEEYRTFVVRVEPSDVEPL